MPAKCTSRISDPPHHHIAMSLIESMLTVLETHGKEGEAGTSGQHFLMQDLRLLLQQHGDRWQRVQQ